MARSIKAILVECAILADELATHDEREDIELEASGAIKHLCQAAEEIGRLYARELLCESVDVLVAEFRNAEASGTLATVGTGNAGTTRTAQADIARRAGTDARTIRRALVRLVELGLVRIVWQGGFRKGPSVYAVAPLPPTL